MDFSSGYFEQFINNKPKVDNTKNDLTEPDYVSVDDEVKKAINKHQKIEQDVINTLKNLGWSNNDILREDKKLNRNVDIVLALNGIEVAIIEIKVNIDIGRNHKRYMQQLYKYAKQHNVSYAYITNGKKIYKYDIVNNLYKKIKNFPSKTELLFDLSKFYQSSNNIIESQIDGDFNGWEGETIIKLINGEFWQQAEYYYQYMYAFMPKVTIINSSTGYKMKVDGIDKEVKVKKLSNVIESKIYGDFNGWSGDTLVELMNGEKWKQSTYAYSYSYAYNPDVLIFESDYGYKMKVDGNDKIVDVKRAK